MDTSQKGVSLSQAMHTNKQAVGSKAGLDFEEEDDSQSDSDFFANNKPEEVFVADLAQLKNSGNPSQQPSL